MRVFDYFSPNAPRPVMPVEEMGIEQRVVSKRLNRILEFARLTIDDVVNNPIAKNMVVGYYKLSRQIDRRSEIVELERQWNAIR